MALTIEVVSWDLYRSELMHIRCTVFVEEQGVPAELEHDEYDADALHLLVRTEGGEPVATARLLPTGHIGRMAVLMPWRGQGIGSTLLRELFQLAQAAGHQQTYLHAQCQAEDFYRRQGFVADGPVFTEAGIPHRRMVRRPTDDA